MIENRTGPTLRKVAKRFGRPVATGAAVAASAIALSQSSGSAPIAAPELTVRINENGFERPSRGADVQPISQEEFDAAQNVRIPTDRLVLYLAPGIDPHVFALRSGLRVMRPVMSGVHGYEFRAPNVEVRDRILNRALGDSAVVRGYANDYLRYETFSFVPDDPLYPNNTPNSSWAGQWHLNNGRTAGADVNIIPVWNKGITGDGVLIGIIDDGYDYNHPDLSPGFILDASFDFERNQQDPAPRYNDPNPGDGDPDIDNAHGTSVAGVAGGRGGNGIGITGAAPLASMSGLRLGFGGTPPNGGITTQDVVDAIQFQSTAQNPRHDVKNQSFGISNIWVPDGASRDAHDDSAAAGTIHVISAGNEGETFAFFDAGKKDMQSSINAINVGSVGSEDTFAAYSSFGANVFVSAHSNGGNFGIRTADRVGVRGYNPEYSFDIADDDYTSFFGGTSSAAPLVAGVMGLLKEYNPDADVRLAKHLIRKSARHVDPGATNVNAYRVNGVGNPFSLRYGFGALDAGKLFEKAPKYTQISPEFNYDSGVINVGVALPDGNGNTVDLLLDPTSMLPAEYPVEEMQVTLNITHPRRGELAAAVTSPMGAAATPSPVQHLMFLDYGSFNGDANIDWTFTMNAFHGENADGDWTISVGDFYPNQTGTINSVRVQLRLGKPLPPDPNILWNQNGKLQLQHMDDLNPTGITPLPTITGWDFEPGDFDGDGDDDLVLHRQSDGLVAIWTLEQGVLQSSSPIVTIPDGEVYVADFDGDGKDDLLFEQDDESFVIWLMDGPVRKASRWILRLPDFDPIMADYNGDGMDDIVWFNPDTGVTIMWVMNGMQWQAWRWLVAVPDSTLDVQDFDNDGNADLLWRENATQQMIMWLMDGTTRKESRSLGFWPTREIEGFGDFNGDNRADIVLRDTGDDRIHVWLMKGTRQIRTGSPGTAEDWDVEIDDFNSDGKSDMLLYLPSARFAKIWAMDGARLISSTAVGTLPSGYSLVGPTRMD